MRKVFLFGNLWSVRPGWMAVPELGWGWGCPLLPRLPLKTYYLHWGAWAESLFPIRVWTRRYLWGWNGNLLDQLYFIPQSIWGEKPKPSSRTAMGWTRGRWLLEMAWHLSPASHGRSALVRKKRLLSFRLSKLALGLGLTSPSGVSFGIGLSECPRFAVTQSPVAVVFSTYGREVAGSGSEGTAGGRASAASRSTAQGGCFAALSAAKSFAFEPCPCVWTQWATSPLGCSSQNQTGIPGPQMLEIQRWGSFLLLLLFFLAATSVPPPRAQHFSVICVSWMHPSSSWQPARRVC